jgi:hypothetical protein
MLVWHARLDERVLGAFVTSRLAGNNPNLVQGVVVPNQFLFSTLRAVLFFEVAR